MTVLPPDAERYLVRMRSLDPPIELVDSIMAEVEATPQLRPAPDLRTVSGFVLAAAAVLLAIAVLFRLGAQNVGPPPTPVPLDQLPSAGTVDAQISMEVGDVPAAFGHGFLWLTNANSGELVRLDPANGSIASPLQVTDAGLGVALALTRSSVWVADSRDGTLVEIDPATLDERRRVPVSASVAVMATDGVDIWLLDVEAGELRPFDPNDESLGQALEIQGSALLAHAGAVWVGTVGGELVRIDPASSQETGRVDLGMTANQLVADGESILVVGGPREPIVRVDLGSMTISGRGTTAASLAAEDGLVWAMLLPGSIARLDPESLQPVAATDVALEPTAQLAVGGGSLWAPVVDPIGDAYLLQFLPER